MTTIVMTGGTSGLGQLAASRILATPGTRLLLGARRPGPPAAETLPLDLTCLDGVRSFATAVGQRLGATPVDALVLNAGRSGRDTDGRTADGLETTFVVNHLAHYLLLRPLVPRANSRKAAGRALAELALGRARPPAGRIYAALRRDQLTWPDPSELARRDELMHALWRDSAELVGLGHQATGPLKIGTHHHREDP